MTLSTRKLVKNFLICSFVTFYCAQFVSTQTPWNCYKCSSTTDDLCLTNPEGTTTGDVTVNCTGYCTIVRTEFTDIPGKVIGLVRDCEKEPLIKNQIRTDAHYTKYYRSCTTNKCNSGDGIIGSGGNGNLPSDVILVPEKSNGYQLSSSYSIQFCILSVLFIKFITR